jgi:hypothetical protein
MIASVAVAADDILGERAHSACEDCPGGDRCKRPEVRKTNGMDWPECPFSLMQDQAWRTVIAVFNASRTSAVEGWGSLWAAWVERGVAAVEAELKAVQLKRLKGGPTGQVVSTDEFMAGF